MEEWSAWVAGSGPDGVGFLGDLRLVPRTAVLLAFQRFDQGEGRFRVGMLAASSSNMTDGEKLRPGVTHTHRYPAVSKGF